MEAALAMTSQTQRAIIEVVAHSHLSTPLARVVKTQSISTAQMLTMRKKSMMKMESKWQTMWMMDLSSSIMTLLMPNLWAIKVISNLNALKQAMVEEESPVVGVSEVVLELKSERREKLVQEILMELQLIKLTKWMLVGSKSCLRENKCKKFVEMKLEEPRMRLLSKKKSKDDLLESKLKKLTIWMIQTI